MDGVPSLHAPALAWALALLGCAGQPDLAEGTGRRIPVPAIRAEYVHVYEPAADVFAGPSSGGLRAGREYGEWIVNDHCFARHGGRWHAFGITHPRTPLERVHAGEFQLFHAAAPAGALRDVLRAAAWADRPKVLAAPERPGEIPENYAPFVLRKDGEFLMVYGPSPLRVATSKDLFHWTPRGRLPCDPGGRDPHILYHRGVYYLVVCGRGEVRMATSRDLETWNEPRVILRMPGGIDPESPTLILRRGTFYLFVCGWNGVWDRKDLDGAYQHVTYVYQSDDPFSFDAGREVCRLPAHAPEIFQDESGEWYISSAQWPRRGVSIARLEWK